MVCNERGISKTVNYYYMIVMMALLFLEMAVFAYLF